MPNYLIKPERDEDLYVDWSTIVEAPVAWGPKWFLQEADPATYKDERFERADEYSTSALWFESYWEKQGYEIYMQQGTIPRSRLKELTEVLEIEGISDDDPRVLALLDPFED